MGSDIVCLGCVGGGGGGEKKKHAAGLGRIGFLGPGPGASGHSNFKGNYPEWADCGYRCLVIDLVGFGFSDKPDDVTYPCPDVTTA